MKTRNSKKIIVSTLSIAMGAALAGSIAGSVAWYQYSTRASVSMVGTAAGTSRNLLVSATGADGTFSTYAKGSDGILKPVRAIHNTTITEGVSDLSNAVLDGTAQGKIAFYDKPVYQYANSGKSISVADFLSGDYAVQQTFYFKVEDRVDGEDPEVQENKNIYLENLEIAGVSAANTLDLSDAVRVNITYSVDGGTTLKGATFGNVASIKQSGLLDIGGASGVLDTDSIKSNDFGGAPVFYGATYTSSTSGTGDSIFNTASQVTNDLIVKDKAIQIRGYYVYNESAKAFEAPDAATAPSGSAKHVANQTALDALIQRQKAAEAASEADVLTDGDEYIVDNEAKVYTITGVKSQTARAISDEITHRGEANYMFASDTDPYDIDGEVFGVTTDQEVHSTAWDMAQVTITVWLEGWGLAGATPSASWDYEDYINSTVAVTAQFTTEAE